MSAEVLHKPELRKSGRIATLLAIGTLAFSACSGEQNSKSKNTHEPIVSDANTPEFVESSSGVPVSEQQALEECVDAIENPSAETEAIAGEVVGAVVVHEDEQGNIGSISC